MTMLNKVLEMLDGLDISVQFSLADTVAAIQKAVAAYDAAGLKPNEAAIYAVLAVAYADKIAENKDVKPETVEKILQGLAEQIG